MTNDFPKVMVLVYKEKKEFFQMAYVEDRLFHQGDALVLKHDEPQVSRGTTSLRVISEEIHAKVVEAYYLSGVRVRVLKGPLPKGRLRVLADGEVLLNEDIAFFAQEASAQPAPAAYPWMKEARHTFQAIPFDVQLAGDLVGFFLTSRTHLEVVFSVEPQPQEARLEVEVLGAMYRSSGVPMRAPAPAKN